jgi:hypothetical protein
MKIFESTIAEKPHGLHFAAEIVQQAHIPSVLISVTCIAQLLHASKRCRTGGIQV